MLLLILLTACSSAESPSNATPSPEASGGAGSGARVDGYPEVAAPTGEWTNKVGDLERDLQNLEAHGAEAAGDFADDLEALGESEEIRPTRSTLEGLAGELAAVLPKTTNGEQLRPRLAQLLYVATRRAAMASDRIDRLRQEVETLLTTHGVPPDRAAVIGGHVSTIARRSRRS